jgi:hypothetical protein
MDGFYQSLMCYHCSDVVVPMGKMSVATMAYGPLLQWYDVVVIVYPNKKIDLGEVRQSADILLRR